MLNEQAGADIGRVDVQRTFRACQELEKCALGNR